MRYDRSRELRFVRPAPVGATPAADQPVEPLRGKKQIDWAAIAASDKFKSGLDLIIGFVVGSSPGTPIAVQGDRRRELWSLSIRNQGNDLSPDEMNQIGAFKQFWHGSQKPQGIGLGLALVQGIARLHGCEFALHSGGSETTATILFPIEA